MRILLALLVLLFAFDATAAPRFRVLVFSKTAGYRHAAIPTGVDALRQLGQAHDFAVDATEDAAVFTPEGLAPYQAVVFLNTTGDVLDAAQEAAFAGFVRGGGGFVGVHAAADTEYDWAWYGGLVGAYFESHPEQQTAEVQVLDRVHPSTNMLPARWERFDEWYNYRVNPRENVHVLAVLAEKSYEGGTMGHDHPIAWAHTYDGGRAWYTGLGHTAESYAEPLFLEHLRGGIEWAAGAAAGDVGATRADNFERVVLTDALTDPMEMGIAHDGRVFIAERAGTVKVWEPATGKTRLAGFVPVRMTVEDGLMGLTLDPGFADNGWLYLYYAPEDGGPQRLARFTYDGRELDPASEKVLLEVRVQYEKCCHSAGGLTFDAAGNLYLSTGDNTHQDASGSPLDERPGHRIGDAQRTSANTNDLRGKILRIRPLPDGTYAIPEGNLFAPGTPKTRPEIYTMGHRNPFRFALDAKTGWLYWGDVGLGNPPNPDRGPWGWEEFGQARGPGNYGWPYFAGPNDAYRDYDYATGVSGPPYDPAAPVNDSPNNSGLRELPPAQPAMIWYTYGPSEEFPELGAGGMSAMGGPIYRYDAATAAPRAFPAYYDGTWIIYEWMRDWIKLVHLDDDGNLLKIDPFLPSESVSRPMDIEFGPDGRLYMIEWGTEFWGSNTNAQVVRLDYYGSPARPPVIESMAAAAPSAVITWPPDGGVFDYDTPLDYEARAVGEGALVVQPYTGHDTHAHALDPLDGTQGTFEITHTFTHLPDLHLMDRFGVLEARAGDGPPASVRLQPRRKEAEQTAVNHGAERKVYGKHPAEPDYAETVLIAMAATDGDHLAYAPVNLFGIDALTFRLKPGEGGAFTVRLDAPDGAVLARVDVPAADEPVAEAATPAETQHDLAMADVPEDLRPAYEGWRTVTVPVKDPGGTHALYLVFEGTGKKMLMQLDWLQFEGPGAARRPEGSR